MSFLDVLLTFSTFRCALIGDGGMFSKSMTLNILQAFGTYFLNVRQENIQKCYVLFLTLKEGNGKDQRLMKHGENYFLKNREFKV